MNYGRSCPDYDRKEKNNTHYKKRTSKIVFVLKKTRSHHKTKRMTWTFVPIVAIFFSNSFQQNKIMSFLDEFCSRSYVIKGNIYSDYLHKFATLFIMREIIALFVISLNARNGLSFAFLWVLLCRRRRHNKRNNFQLR